VDNINFDRLEILVLVLVNKVGKLMRVFGEIVIEANISK
jgi:hypothetical protein